MSLRALIALLLIAALAFLFAFVYFSSSFVESHILTLLPPSFGSDTVTAIHFVIFEQSVGILACAFVIAVLFFWIFSSMVVRPLRELLHVMNAFAADGTRLPMPKLSGTATEISLLGKSFNGFADKVTEAHKKDSEISRVKSDFISTAAHQLRTPLTGIRWALEALQNETLTEDQRMLVKNAVDKSHDLVAIVGTLLDISSIESGKYKYTFESCDLSALVAEVAQDFSPLAQKNNVSLFYAKESAPLPKVNADRDRIKWVLNNLIENAIRYTPAEGTVRLTVDSSAGLVFVRVKDSGIGIDAKDRGNIFERFYRAGNAITKENQGNGLGLYIARTIATDHGGDLDFEANTEGPGTTFVLSLPIA